MRTFLVQFYIYSNFTMHSENNNMKTVDAQQARIINLHSMCIFLALFYVCILYI